MSKTSKSKSKAHIRTIHLVGIRDGKGELSELACRLNNNSDNPNLEMEPLIWSEELGEAIGVLRTRRRIAAGEELTWDYDYDTATRERMMQCWRQPDDFPTLGMQFSAKDHFRAGGILYECKFCNEKIRVGKSNMTRRIFLLKKHLGIVDDFLMAAKKLNGRRKRKNSKAKKDALQSPTKRQKKPTRRSSRLKNINNS